jgi:L-tryptophan--pyruvate aminotransferase
MLFLPLLLSFTAWTASASAASPAPTLPTTCTPSSLVDDCLPNGKYDVLQGKCVGYNGQSCFGCYSGPNCNLLDTSCVLNMVGGQPAVFEEYWEEETELCASTKADFQTTYQGRVVGEGVYAPLEAEIRRLHNNVGNAETEGYEVVLGAGGTGVMNAVLYAIAAAQQNGTTSNIFAQVPFYGNYVQQTANTMAYSSSGERAVLNFDSEADPSDSSTYEIVTYPNNPDGIKRKALVADRERVIYDAIYYWPQFAEIDVKLEHEIMIFSASKHTGHAGSRLGWALVKNPAIAELMRTFVQRELGISMDAQIRMTYTLNYLNHQFDSPPSTGQTFYEFGKSTMTSRFDAISKLFTDEATGELTSRRGISFVNNSTRGAYAWLQHDDPTIDLRALLQGEALIAGSGGANFGATPDFARLQIMARSVEIEDMMNRLEQFLETPEDVGERGKYAKERWENVERSKSGGC